MKAQTVVRTSLSSLISRPDPAQRLHRAEILSLRPRSCSDTYPFLLLQRKSTTNRRERQRENGQHDRWRRRRYFIRNSQAFSETHFKIFSAFLHRQNGRLPRREEEEFHSSEIRGGLQCRQGTITTLSLFPNSCFGYAVS